MSRSSRPTARSSAASGAACTSANAVGWRSSRSAVTTPSGLLSIRWTASCSATRRSSSMMTVAGSASGGDLGATLVEDAPGVVAHAPGLDQARGRGARAGEVAGQQDVETWHGDEPIEYTGRATRAMSSSPPPSPPPESSQPPPPQGALHVVLVAPEIPWNTGNAGRTCLAVGAQLHLVEPLGFSLDERAVRRSGLDYWVRVVPNLHVWPTWAALEAAPARAGHALLLRSARHARLSGGALPRAHRAGVRMRERRVARGHAGEIRGGHGVDPDARPRAAVAEPVDDGGSGGVRGATAVATLTITSTITSTFTISTTITGAVPFTCTSTITGTIPFTDR